MTAFAKRAAPLPQSLRGFTAEWGAAGRVGLARTAATLSPDQTVSKGQGGRDMNITIQGKVAVTGESRAALAKR